jgi:hypothetical protein
MYEREIHGRRFRDEVILDQQISDLVLKENEKER